MSELTNHELMSAYLDGELSPAERQRAEQLLAENADCRQVYEELRALRASLAALPRQKLAEDLAQRILGLAEQASKDKVSLSSGTEDRERAAADRRSRNWRRIIYPVLVAAAAVAYMFNVPKEKDKHPREMARVPHKQPPADVSAAPADAGRKEAELLDDYDQPDAGNLFGADRSMVKGRLNAEAGPREERLDSRGVSAKSAAAGKQNTAADATTSDAFRAGAAKPAAGTMGGMGGRAPNKPGLVITCKLTPTAISGNAFETMLARNHLTPIPAAAAAGEPAAASGAAAEAVPEQKVLQPKIKTSTESLAKKDDMAEDSPVADEPLDRDQRPAAWSQDVVVELDAEQLVALLADLQQHPDQFVSVELPGTAAKSAGKAGKPEGLRKSLLYQAPQAKPAGPEPALPKSAVVAGSGDAPERVRVLFRLSGAAD